MDLSATVRGHGVLGRVVDLAAGEVARVDFAFDPPGSLASKLEDVPERSLVYRLIRDDTVIDRGQVRLDKSYTLQLSAITPGEYQLAIRAFPAGADGDDGPVDLGEVDVVIRSNETTHATLKLDSE